MMEQKHVRSSASITMLSEVEMSLVHGGYDRELVRHISSVILVTGLEICLSSLYSHYKRTRELGFDWDVSEDSVFFELDLFDID